MCGQTDKGCVSARFKLPERNASGMRLHLWRGDQLLSTNMKELLLWLCPCVASYVQSPSRSFWARLPACELSCTSSCACGCDCESTLETVFAGKAHLIAVTPPPLNQCGVVRSRVPDHLHNHVFWAVHLVQAILLGEGVNPMHKKRCAMS